MPSPLVIGAGLVLIIASLYWAQAVLIPVALAMLLTFLLTPVVNGLERIGLGRIVSVIVAVVLAFSFLTGIAWIMTSQVTTLADELPNYERNIKQKIADVKNMGKGGTLEQMQKTIEEIKEEIEKSDQPTRSRQRPGEVTVKSDRSSGFVPIPVMIGPLMERLASAGLVIILVIFMLSRREDLRNRLIRLVGYGRMTVTTKALEDAGDRISRYLLVQSIINSFFGLVVGIGLFLMGLPYAILWGLLAGLLRFVPYVGPWIGASMPSLLSFAAFEGWLWPIAVVGLFVVMELFTNMVLETLLWGESAGVSPVALLIAVAFWTWLWGPIGLLMATPLTVCLVVLGKYVPQMEFITVLMSDEPVADNNMIYYQRLLAIDQEEAAHIVTEYLKTHPRERLYDEVLVPALNFARTDRERGSLMDADEQFVYQATRAIVEALDSKQPTALTTDGDGSKEQRAGRETTQEVSAPSQPNVRVLGCPARDEADEVTLVMFRQLLNSTRYQVEVIAEEKLTSEVVVHAGEKKAELVCIAAVQPGGQAHTRYLCKRLRGEFPDLKIVVGLWGFKGELGPTRDSLLSAGADEVGTGLLETRDQIINLGQLITDPDTVGHTSANRLDGRPS